MYNEHSEPEPLPVPEASSEEAAPPLDQATAQILAWAEAYFRREGHWPQSDFE